MYYLNDLDPIFVPQLTLVIILIIKGLMLLLLLSILVNYLIWQREK